jgi:Tol biopolymer transport system component
MTQRRAVLPFAALPAVRLITVVAVGVAVGLAVPAVATPPGSKGLIVWQREQSNAPPHLWVANNDGSSARPVFGSRTGADFEGSFSPTTPNLVVFTRGRRPAFSEDIYAGDLATGQVRRIVKARSADVAPSVSPDGTRITYFGVPRPAVLREDRPPPPERIHVANLDGSGDRAITPRPRRSIDPDWSPDGTQITYSEARSVTPNRAENRLMVINADGTGRRALTSFGGVDEVNPKWMPDGQTIVFERLKQTGAKSDLAAVPAAGGPARTLLATPNYETNPIPSPDGTRILFTSDRDRPGKGRLGRGFELYTMALDGSDLVRLTNNRSPDIFPDWQRLP